MKRHEAGPFFVLRTPLLPADDWLAWSRDLDAPGAEPDALTNALERDRERLQDRLREAYARPEVLEALHLASPGLHDRSESWRKGRAKPGSADDSVATALLRYFTRMCLRPTPFGIFAGCSIGRIGERTRLALGARDGYSRTSRLDMDFVTSLTASLERERSIRNGLTLSPNTSLYRAGRRYRYAEGRVDGRLRAYHLVAVEESPYLTQTLERARDGATREDLAAALVAGDPDIAKEDAEAFVDELIDSQLLTGDLEPPVTGGDPLEHVAEKLEALGAAEEIVKPLRDASESLAALDRCGVGADPERYRALAASLESLPPDVDPGRLVQVDMTKPAPEAVVGGAVLEELQRGVALLHEMHPVEEPSAISRFSEEFKRRYEDRWVPLNEVLDEEIGIGFDKSGAPQAESAPLLAKLVLGGRTRAATAPWGKREHTLARLTEEAVADGAREIRLSSDDIDALREPEPPPLPDAFTVSAVVCAPSRAAIETGEFRVGVQNVTGPSGARLLGRFCHADETLAAHVREHAEREESLDRARLYAEIVHLPEGRIGNVLLRPLLRGWEIPFLGRSGAPVDRQIPVRDLLVGVAGGRVVLRSVRLGVEVVPRMSTAHNYDARGLGLYKLLCRLQSQGVADGLGWRWGPLGALPFRPRVATGRVVLSRAEWSVRDVELKPLVGAREKERFERVNAWRARRRIPRYAALREYDNELFIDFENVACVDMFASAAARRPRLDLVEPWCRPDELCATGPEGRFTHEILVPFVRAAPTAIGDGAGRSRAATIGRGPRPASSSVRRSFPPGSPWVYVKLYTGTSTADVVLREVIAPAVRDLEGSGGLESWHFVRFADPDWHVRARFFGETRADRDRVNQVLLERAGQAHAQGLIWKIALDTYEREVDRYGGAEGIELAERVAWVDSTAVLRLLALLEGDGGADTRWRLVVRGIDDLLESFGYDLDGKLATMAPARTGFGREFGENTALRRQLSGRFRDERRAIESLLGPEGGEPGGLLEGVEVLCERRSALREVCERYRALENEERLVVPLEDVVRSLIHMFANRLLRASARAQELVIYDFLVRHYTSLAARARRRGAPRAS